jgi:hypothetical protein
LELQMTKRRFWRATAVIFALGNVGGAIYALINGEMMHAGTHVALLAGTFVLWQALSSGPEVEESPIDSPEIDTRLESLQQSLDAVALEVERIGEGQRFVTKVLQEQPEVTSKPDTSR